VFLRTLSETLALGKNFGKNLNPMSIVLIKGPIGAGKTSFVQGIAEGLMIKDQITSPTFALSHHYMSDIIPLIHMDLYRINNKLSAEELFLEEEEEMEKHEGILVVEWPELIIPIIDNYWFINIDYADQSGREINIYEPKFFKKD
tara:strand:+ start:1007 stop:1441 length:435 start_codon:yes stop_codon:yes gene_type:complete